MMGPAWTPTSRISSEASAAYGPLKGQIGRLQVQLQLHQGGVVGSQGRPRVCRNRLLWYAFAPEADVSKAGFIEGVDSCQCIHRVCPIDCRISPAVGRMRFHRRA